MQQEGGGVGENLSTVWVIVLPIVRVYNLTMVEDKRIKEARRLLWEVTNEQRHKEKEKVLNTKCRCEHTRRNHSVAHSINYTGGVCKVRKCECMNFM